MSEFDVPGFATACSGIHCQGYWPGHNMHPIHASRIGRTPWGWRDALVVAREGHLIRVEYLDGSATPLLWHHRAPGVESGDPVRVHEQFHALGFPFGWFNVALEGGLGAVPEPVDTAEWLDRMRIGVMDMSMGNGLAVDHAHPLDPT